MDKQTNQRLEAGADKGFSSSDTADRDAGNKASQNKAKKNKGGQTKKRSKANTVVLVVLIVLTALLNVALVLSLFAPQVFDLLFRPDPLDTDKPVMSVNGYDVLADEYRKALLDMNLQYEDLTLGGGNITIAEFFRRNPSSLSAAMREVEESLVTKYCLMTWAANEGFTVEGLDPAEVDEFIAKQIEAMGGEEYYEDSLIMNNFTEEGFQLEMRQQLVIAKLQEQVYAEDSEFMTVTSEDRTAFWDEVGMYAVKQIYFMRSNSDEENAAKIALAQDVLQQLRDGADYDELMNTYSEDAGLAAQPDGYYVLPNEMPIAFESAALALDDGEISDIVETSAGWHIILRYFPTQEQLDNNYYLYNTIVNDRVTMFLEGMKSMVLVEYGECFDDVDLTNVINPFEEQQEAIAEKYAELEKNEADAEGADSDAA